MTAVSFETAALTRGLCERLGQLQAPRPLVISCYVSLGPDDRAGSRYAIEAGAAMQRLGREIERYGLEPAEREMLQQDFNRIEEVLADPNHLTHLPALAIYASELLGLFEMIPLPRVFGTRVLLDVRPRIAELLDVIHDAGPVAVAAVDRAHARFFEVSAFGVQEVADQKPAATRGGKYHSDRGDAPGWGEAHFHHRVEEERRRQAADVADELVLLVTRLGAESILLAGPPRTTAKVLEALPQPYRDRVIGRVRLNPTALTGANIVAAAAESRAVAERKREQRLVAELESALDTGWAVAGVRPTIQALGQGQVRMLFLRANQSLMGFRCGPGGRLVVAPGDCMANGPPVPVDLVNECIEEALRHHIPIVMVRNPALGAWNGFAALLRYR